MLLPAWRSVRLRQVAACNVQEDAAILRQALDCLADTVPSLSSSAGLPAQLVHPCCRTVVVNSVRWFTEGGSLRNKANSGGTEGQ